MTVLFVSIPVASMCKPVVAVTSVICKPTFIIVFCFCFLLLVLHSVVVFLLTFPCLYVAHSISVWCSPRFSRGYACVECLLLNLYSVLVVRGGGRMGEVCILLSWVNFVYCFEYGIVCINVCVIHIQIILTDFINVIHFQCVQIFSLSS
jgi:hypothetical protein